MQKYKSIFKENKSKKKLKEGWNVNEIKVKLYSILNVTSNSIVLQFYDKKEAVKILGILNNQVNSLKGNDFFRIISDGKSITGYTWLDSDQIEDLNKRRVNYEVLQS